jgi:large subunit ribosomal protein L6
MKFIINNSLLNLTYLEKEIGLYNNYFVINIENNLGHYYYISKFFKNNLLSLKYKNFIYFFKTRNLNCFINNFKKSIFSIFFGYFTELILIGLGFKITRLKRLRLLVFELNFSHQIIYKIPLDIIIKTSKKNIIIFGLNKERVINISNQIINLRFPNIYKGKGIRYLNQIIKLKSGKQR